MLNTGRGEPLTGQCFRPKDQKQINHVSPVSDKPLKQAVSVLIISRSVFYTYPQLSPRVQQ